MNRLYLTTSDYKYSIQNSQLNQLLQISGVGGAPLNTQPPNNNVKLIQAEKVAINLASSYLTQRWDCSAEFVPISAWDYNTAYIGNNRIVLDYATFATSSAYATGSCVVYDGLAYMSNGVTASSTTPDTGNWTVIGNQFDIFYGANRFTAYDDETYYYKNDVVFYGGHTYSCLQESTDVTGGNLYLRFGRLENIPDMNVTPGTDSSAWFDSGTVSIPLHTLPSDTTYWTLGDNRCPQIMMIVQDIVLFQLLKSIAPSNIPDFREKAYEQALKWLRLAAQGEITISMPELAPTQGLKIRFSGPIRKNNRL